MFEIKGLTEYREEIKKSKFYVLAQQVESVEDALKFIEENKDLSANHNCWAFKINNEYRFNDDGEPSGTAGKPIFSAIEHAKITNVVVLIIRWFGGVKLGTGGLCRAYGGTASKCLELAEKCEIIEKDIVLVKVPFDFSNFIYNEIDSSGFPKIEEEYTENGLEISVEIPVMDFNQFKENVTNATHGKGIIKIKNSS